MADFSKQFEIIYDKFAREAKAEDRASSKLAFSRFVGVSQGCMQNWEKGKVPTGKDLKAIHDRLGFAYDWLISGEGEPYDERDTPSQGEPPEQTTPDEKDRLITELLLENRELRKRLEEKGL